MKISQSKEAKAIRRLLHKKLDQEAVWDILTFLRGPDKHGGLVKAATVSLARSRLGIVKNSIKRSVKDTPIAWRVDVEPVDFASFKVIRSKLKYSGHFAEHAQNAFRALGLSWDEVNE